jgi:hypothetical protein
MIQVMPGPFRHNKKQRKYYRRRAKAELKAADKFAAEGNKPHAVEVLRRLAESNTKMSLAKRRKKKSKISS